MPRPVPITIHSSTIDLVAGEGVSAAGNTRLHIPTWPKSEYTKDQLLDMVLETCPHPRRLYYVDLGDTHGACAIH